jgi:Cu/Ag efflux protein CusF
MMNRRGVLLVLMAGLSLVLGRAAAAHEGHDHKVMGTVSAIQENQLEVKGTDGKSVTVTLNDKTKILRGKEKATKAEIQTGERIVVVYFSKDKANIAREVRLAPKTTSS